MKNRRRVIACISAILFFLNSFPEIGQTQTMMPSMNPGRYLPSEMSGSSENSFGQKLGGGTGNIRGPFGNLPSPTTLGTGPQIFQEPGFSGLTYQVHILGEVSKPGTYRVTASTRLSEALKMAGEILGQGSERRIELRRREGGSRKVDLISFRLSGNLDENPYLLDNDVVFVPLRERVVQIVGTVKRPGVYELIKEKTIQDLVDLAGGFTPGVANPTPIKVVRFNDGKKEVIDVENTSEPRKSFEISNADIVIVPHFLTEGKKFDYNLASLPGDNALFYPSYDARVYVLGAVWLPGPVPYNPYYSTRQYLTLAGGTTKLAKSRQIRIVHVDGKTERVPRDKDRTIVVNPGDTILVPERYMPPESILSLVLGVTASTLGITTTVLTLTR